MTSKRGTTALHLAAANGHREIVEILLDKFLGVSPATDIYIQNKLASFEFIPTIFTECSSTWLLYLC